MRWLSALMTGNDYQLKLVGLWRWAIEVFCAGLVVWCWASRAGLGTQGSRDVEGGVYIGGLYTMPLLLITSIGSWKRHRNYALLGFLIIIAWLVLLFFFPRIYG